MVVNVFPLVVVWPVFTSELVLKVVPIVVNVGEWFEFRQRFFTPPCWC